MARLVFWFDLETTGTNPQKNDVVELAYQIEANHGTSDKKVIEEGCFQMAPFNPENVSQGALDATGFTLVQVKAFEDPRMVHTQLCLAMDPHCNRYNRNDKMVLAGYNVSFDDAFFREFFKKAGDKFYGSWFLPCRIDVMSEVAKWQAISGVMLPNFKLGTVCHHFGIDIEAHKAASDINATRELYYRLQKEMRS